jgi:hypothetical protein
LEAGYSDDLVYTFMMCTWRKQLEGKVKPNFCSIEVHAGAHPNHWGATCHGGTKECTYSKRDLDRFGDSPHP